MIISRFQCRQVRRGFHQLEVFAQQTPLVTVAPGKLVPGSTSRDFSRDPVSHRNSSNAIREVASVGKIGGPENLLLVSLSDRSDSPRAGSRQASQAQNDTFKEIKQQ